MNPASSITRKPIVAASTPGYVLRMLTSTVGGEACTLTEYAAITKPTCADSNSTR